MVLTVKERKARRQAGMDSMTEVKKIRRDLTGGRPPAGELKTPTGAVTAARIFYRELESRMKGLNPKPGDLGVSVGYVSPDLSVLGFSPLFVPGSESELMKHLSGHVMLGLIFGMADKDADEDERFVMGARPFFVTAQTEDWLDELALVVRSEMMMGER
jgi:hypothetical protein